MKYILLSIGILCGLSLQAIEVDSVKYPIRGIDISMYAGQIDWNMLKKNGIQFAYIKCTEGGDYHDPNYSQYFYGARQAKIHFGGYHFYRFEKSGKEQADNFLRHLPRHYKQQLPPVIDIEDYNPDKPGVLPLSQCLSGIEYIIHKVREHTNHQPIIYTNKHTYEILIKEKFKKSKYWISSTSKDPYHLGISSLIYWQYAHNTKIKGVSGIVDMNVYYSSLAQWKKYLAKHGLKYYPA